MRKLIKNLKAGDVVLAHGHRLLVTEDARYSLGHVPAEAYGCAMEFVGPSEVASAPAVCLDETNDPYFANGWSFQGNLLAGYVTTEGA